MVQSGVLEQEERCSYTPDTELETEQDLVEACITVKHVTIGYRAWKAETNEQSKYLGQGFAAFVGVEGHRRPNDQEDCPS